MITVERDNVRFTLSNPRFGLWVFNAERISDSHRLPGQKLFSKDPSDFMGDIIKMWESEHGHLKAEPIPIRCYACGGALVSDHDTEYQFDNALWIALHGGYGMFVDACEFPTNTADRWFRDDAGEYILAGDGQPIEDPDWEPDYPEPRTLPGRPDKEVVICHSCAHDLCEKVPWMNTLIEPLSSHAHRYQEIPSLLAEGHRGWDLDGHTPE